MGWADCGDDSQGRPIGYGFEATCDHPECDEVIDRGLAYACGGMHGDNGDDCEKYFCGEHLLYTAKAKTAHSKFLCMACHKLVVKERGDEDEE